MNQVYKQQGECCSELVNHLIKVIKFKSAENNFLKRLQETGGVLDDQLQQAKEAVEKLKPQEEIVMNIIKEEVGRLKEIQARKEELEEEEEVYEEEMVLDHQSAGDLSQGQWFSKKKSEKPAEYAANDAYPEEDNNTNYDDGEEEVVFQNPYSAKKESPED